MGGDDDVVIRDLENPVDFDRKLVKQKHNDAKWVAGLSPQDELRAAALAKARRELKNPNSKVDSKKMLQRPMLFGLIAILALLYRILCAEPFYLDLEFPTSEVPTWKLVKQLEVVDYLTILSLPLTGCLFTGSVCLVLGALCQQLVLFMGVGVSALGVFAAVGESVILHGACSTFAGGDECFIPITLLWTVVAISQVAPFLALMTTSLVWDQLMKQDSPEQKVEDAPAAPEARPRRGIPKWLCLFAIPVLVLLAEIAYHYWYGAPNHKLVHLFRLVQLVVYFVFWRRLYTQPKFVVVFDNEKRKQE